MRPSVSGRELAALGRVIRPLPMLVCIGDGLSARSGRLGWAAARPLRRAGSGPDTPDRAPSARDRGINHRVSYARSAAAGAVAATAWALAEPLDRRLLRYDYSDVALLGKALTRGPRWRAAGLALHATNGAVFGLAFETVQRRTGVDRRRLALGLALLEHVTLFPLSYVVDRHHPARGEPGIPPLLGSPRAFAQATWRHALFGVVLGRLA